MSSGFGDDLRVVRVVCSLAGWSRGDAIGVSQVSGCRVGVVVLGRRWPGQPRTSRDPPCG